MTHVRPDVPQPDPIVHDKPGDVPQVPCAEELDEHKPGAPYGNQTEADTDDPQTTCSLAATLMSQPFSRRLSSACVSPCRTAP